MDLRSLALVLILTIDELWAPSQKVCLENQQSYALWKSRLKALEEKHEVSLYEEGAGRSPRKATRFMLLALLWLSSSPPKELKRTEGTNWNQAFARQFQTA